MLRGHRSTYGGRRALRSTLYMAALTAARTNPDIRAFYLRLVNAGTPKRLALVACLRKLLLTANALLREHRIWQPTMEQAA